MSQGLLPICDYDFSPLFFLKYHIDFNPTFLLATALFLIPLLAAFVGRWGPTPLTENLPLAGLDFSPFPVSTLCFPLGK